MKLLFYLQLSLLIFISSHVTVEEKSHINSTNNQNTFLVKTNLTKDEIKYLLEQHQRKQKQHQGEPTTLLNSQNKESQTQLKVKKEKSQKKHKKEKDPEINQVEIKNHTESEVPESQETKPSEKISLNVVNGTNNNNESDQFDTEDPPEPDLENETETSEKPESAAENVVLKINKTNLLCSNDEKNVTKIEKTILINTNKSTIQNGMSISGFFSLIILSIAFISFFIYVTQPKKNSKFYSKNSNELSESLLIN